MEQYIPTDVINSYLHSQRMYELTDKKVHPKILVECHLMFFCKSMLSRHSPKKRTRSRRNMKKGNQTKMSASSNGNSSIKSSEMSVSPPPAKRQKLNSDPGPVPELIDLSSSANSTQSSTPNLSMALFNSFANPQPNNAHLVQSSHSKVFYAQKHILRNGLKSFQSNH